MSVISAVPKRRTAVRESRGDRIFLVFVYTFLGIIALLVLYPMVYVVSSSFSSGRAVLSGRVVLWPVDPTLDGYRGMLSYAPIPPAFLYSVLYTVGGTALTVVLTIAMAYPLSRKDFYGRKVWIWLLLLALMFNGGLIPFYLVVKTLGMINTIWSQMVPGALNVFLVILAKTFFQQTISNELYEAAAIDGASDIAFLIRIALPLSKPIIAVITLLTAVGIWNSYFSALIFLNSESLYPLQMVLREIVVYAQVTAAGFGFNNMTTQQIVYFQNLSALLKYALIVVSTVPMLLLYPLAQRYFVQGLMLGSLKE
jgi:ABC-type glycerol-3-phosphate transport system permease component